MASFKTDWNKYTPRSHFFNMKKGNELAYYHCKLNVRVTSQVAEQLKDLRSEEILEKCQN